MTLRHALIGYGKIARDQHVGAVAATEGIELVAVADPHNRHDSLPSFPSLEALLASDIAFDSVAIATPPQVRHGQARIALDAGKHVLLEKPPGATVAELPPLQTAASDKGVTLFTAWHSQFAAAVAPAREILASRKLLKVEIEWKEDVRHTHPGQSWIFEAGGLGVFDPGINALSILTAVLPRPFFLERSNLAFPVNKQAPVAAELTFRDDAGLSIALALDFLTEGPMVWYMHFDTDAGRVTLGGGGTTLTDNGQAVAEAPDREYPALYKHFVALAAEGRSDVDLRPLVHVSDAFLLGRRRDAPAFEDF